VIEAPYSRAELAGVYLPTGPMLLIDRVVEVQEDGIHCELDLESHWVFEHHFPGDPIFPASLMIEAAGQAIAIWCWHEGIAGKPRLARVKAAMEAEARPDAEVLVLRARMRRRQNICAGEVELFCGAQRVAVIEETLAFV